MDTLRELAAAELRATLARRRISAVGLARRLGWSQPYMARRVDGRIALDMDDLETITKELEISVGDLLPKEARQPTREYEPSRLVATIGQPRTPRPAKRPVRRTRPLDAPKLPAGASRRPLSRVPA